MKNLILTLIFILPATVFAQNYFQTMYNQGWQQQQKGELYPAIKSYSSAILFAKTEADKKKVQNQINACAQELENLKKLANEALREAEKQKMKVKIQIIEANERNRLLDIQYQRAEAALHRMGIIAFDKAVRKKFPDWEGIVAIQNRGDTEMLNIIDSLDLSNNYLLKLPAAVFDCKKLTHINLSENPDLNWDETFRKLKKTNVTSVYVSIPDLDSIPQQYWPVVKGVELINFGNSKTIPANILQQTQLEWLKIKIQPDNHAPSLKITEHFYNLTNLKKLELTGLAIDTLSASIQKLKKLEWLDFSNNRIAQIPSEIGKLEFLKHLNFYNNQITAIPFEIGNLWRLNEMNFAANSLSEIPTSVTDIKYLKTIDLTLNKITELPGNISYLYYLKKLAIGNNQISDIEPVSKVRNVEELYIASNPITEMPKEIAAIPTLRILYMPGVNPDNESFAAFLNECPKDVEITSKNSRYYNSDARILRITVSKINYEWERYKKVTILER